MLVCPKIIPSLLSKMVQISNTIFKMETKKDTIHCYRIAPDCLRRNEIVNLNLILLTLDSI